ncbi:uncharacterized protein LOC132296216 [Cornus florida]|uniref:uncharacterized protein LOC132296216 n=1 Tax=Cornus florida TaxID=4283 RepID=UPI00289D3D40|nr:uncharacterized protein LOC132296216 [Cornus florida]
MVITSGTITVPTPTPAPQIIVHQDNSTFPTRIILDETNYSLWSQLVEIQVGAGIKAGYLTGEVTKPAPGNPKLEAWITENHRGKSWLIGSMNPLLMQRFIHLPMAKEIWEAVFVEKSCENPKLDLEKLYAYARREYQQK